MSESLLNRVQMTGSGFLAYFVMSAVISPLGLITAPIAAQYGVSLTDATSAFGYLTTGILVGTIVAIFIFDYVPMKAVVVGGVTSICAAIYALYAVDSYVTLKAALALIGASCGIELSAAAVVMTQLYEEKLRASMLLLTDSFYSIAGVISTWLAGLFLARELHWSSAYVLAFIVSAMIAMNSATSSYPQTATPVVGGNKRAWPLRVHQIGFAIFVYLIGFVTIYSWVPNYAQDVLGVDVASSGTLVGRLFLGMFIGQLIMFFLVLRVALIRLIYIYAVMATALTSFLWLAGNATQLTLAMLVLGLVTGGLLKTVITYGTTIVDRPSARMVSYLVFCAGAGTAVAPSVSAYVVEQSDMRTVLQFVTACYVLMVLMLLSAREKTHH